MSHDKCHKVLVRCVVMLAFLATFTSAFLIPRGDTRKFYDLIYQVLENEGNPCVLLLDRDTQFGCKGTPINGGSAIAPLYAIESAAAFEAFVLNQKEAKNSASPFIVLLPTELMTSVTMRTLNDSSLKVSGILITTNSEKPPTFSSAERSPNQQYGLYPNERYEWNSIGTSINRRLYSMPILLLNSTVSTDLIAKARENMERKFAYPLYAMEMEYFMSASSTHNSIQCITQNKCQPLGGFSVWSSLYPLPKTPPIFPRKLIVVSSTIDADAFFHSHAIGAAARQTAVIANILAADALRKQKDSRSFVKDIIFTFFDAEVWGYTGSRRFVHEIQNFKCKSPNQDGTVCNDPFKYNLEFTKLNLENIEHIIEVDQIASVNSLPQQLFLHVDKTSQTAQNVSSRSLIGTLTSVASALQMNVAESSVSQLPPSSLHTFLRAKPTQSGVVIADFDTHYSNRYFHSQFDDRSNVDIQRLCDTATLLTNTLYSLATPTQAITSSLTVNCSLAAELVDCLTANWNCSLMRNLSPASNGIPTHYSSVYAANFLTETPYFIHSIMSAITVDRKQQPLKQCYAASDCAKDFDCVNGECAIASTYYHDAYSLALEYVTGGGWQLLSNANFNISGEPIFTESNWVFLGARLFLQDGTGTDVWILFAGITNTILTIAFVWGVERIATRFHWS